TELPAARPGSWCTLQRTCGDGSMTGKLDGRKALVTGASGGFGSAIAKGLAQEGAAVAVHARRQDAGQAVVEEIHAAGGRAVLVRGDVSDPDESSFMVQQAIADLGGLDILVNNAGVMSETPFLELDGQEWNRVIGTNLTGYFLVGQAAAKHMVEHGG